MKIYQIPIISIVTAEEIDDFMSAALEGGINYWCDEVKIDKKPDEECKYASEVLTRGGTLKIYVSEEDEIQVLTLEKLLNALSKENVNMDEYDAVVADNVIQQALFGDIIFS